MGHKRGKKKKKEISSATFSDSRLVLIGRDGKNERICKSWYLEDHLKGPEYKQSEEKGWGGGVGALSP